MKQTKISISIGMAVTFAAFVAMAVGAVFTWNWLFFVGVGLLLIGIACMMLVPAVIISRWNKLMNEHGVPATAKLISCTKTTGAMAEIRLEFAVTDTDIITAGIVSVNSKKEFNLDTIWNIKYDPDNTELCLVISQVPQTELPQTSNIEEEGETSEGFVNTTGGDNIIVLAAESTASDNPDTADSFGSDMPAGINAGIKTGADTVSAEETAKTFSSDIDVSEAEAASAPAPKKSAAKKSAKK